MLDLSYNERILRLYKDMTQKSLPLQTRLQECHYSNKWFTATHEEACILG